MTKFQLTIAALVITILAGCNAVQQPQGEVQVLTVSASASTVTLADRNELAYFHDGSTLGSGGGAAPLSQFDVVQLENSADLARFQFESGTMAAYAISDAQNVDLVQLDNHQNLADFHTK